ncbi:TIGR03560 family F420-dependent LLM class oxidoreductase [Pseudactinotalea sp. HY160]|uniref:TIGR03560 family F420-dependent LLM class oxidoreductase n=1 Tax=Pseudactinotalea sp. HY160 TaxID=2654490 RepID=UPI00128B8EF1|nr:TIGR03560 family F420-dependent LLM class oxidoreductase [Pseudactinotalea sp. HY160]MPV50536.1 TIGR03560 family F420-dependent LLM class oxidoreductase [Pseudactinotalea sp. HY160]
MRVSVNITDYSWRGRLAEELTTVVRAADAAGVDTVWVADHLVQADPNSTPDAEMLEAYTTLGFLAGQTRRVRLGTMVSAATYRPPALLIKATITLDVLSGGRAWLGLGAGYQQDEARAMGLPLPAVAERFERLEDVLRLARQMFAGDAAAFSGDHYELARPIASPRPLTRPHPPILVGGMGERKTLRLVAAYADACNLFDIPDGGTTLTHKLDVLADHCRAVGRPYDQIDKTVSTRLSPGETPEQFIRRCTELAALGIEHAVVIAPGAWSEDTIAILAAAIPALRGLAPGDTHRRAATDRPDTRDRP